MIAGLMRLPAADANRPWTLLAACVAAACLIFQVGHFIEHFLQFAVWVLGDLSNICGRDTPWMSPWVSPYVEAFGAWAWPAVGAKVQMVRSMEVLHIVGNSIFLIGLWGLFYLRRNTWVKWALTIETFHLYEHVMLTVSAFTVGKPIGLSTLFGGSFLLDKEAAVGIRVTWHFVMNLFPMPFAMLGMTWNDEDK
ncbi:DUF6008 family protein [uncultured Methylobacterium sp.]|jgi:hypothetical protein|uniref:DUF6008 family protein n=1 Tax=uncultured Methylobacterium sp. TaxID=157278 RepID=UPI00261253D6|nr:DUF6008 family protein [uncultured Methylobacterium sp.]